MRIGIAGVGRMGAAMAARLVEQGVDVTVWNRSPARAAATGLPMAATPAALAAAVDAVITILFDAAAVEAVYHGPDGLLASAPGKLFIEMSTVRPETQVTLAQAVQAAGGAILECPVGGTTGPARAGKLLGLAGGDAATLARARPLLDMLCRRVEHVGPHGAGAAMKLAINLPLLVFYQALGEALSLIQHLNLDPAFLMEFFADTSGGANVLKVRGPAIAATLAGAPAIAATLAGAPTIAATLGGAPTFDIASIRKDLQTMLAEARSRGFTLPVAAQTLAIYDQADAAGWGQRDGAWLPAYWPHHHRG